MAYVDAVLYLRQSQDRTGEELGVSRQREDGRRLAALRGWTIVAEYADNDLSAAGKRRRPGFEAVLQAVEAGRATCVIAWDMSRITRNARDRLRLLELGKQRGLVVAFVRGSDLDLSTPAGRLTADILGSVAQHEIDQKSDRQSRAARQAAEQGRRIGGRRPFGYDSDGVTVRPAEAAAFAAGCRAVLDGVPLARIAAGWNHLELFTPQNRRDGSPSPWTAQTIRSTLLNPRYAGLRSHVTAMMLQAMDPRVARIKGVVGHAAWPALVSEETWQAVVEVLTDPSRANLPRGARGLLSGVGLCGVCGATVHRGGSPAGAGGRRYATYRCRAAMGHIGRAAAPVDRYVGEVVVERMQEPDAALLLVDEQRPDAGELRTEAAALRSRLDSLAGLLADGVLTETAVRREAVRLRAKLDAVQQEQASAGRINALAPLITADDAGAVWESLDVDRRRAVVEMLMTVTLLPPGRGVRTFRPETVVVTWAD